MEITMTLIVTPEQAAAIAGLLAGSKPLNPSAPPLQSEPLPTASSQPAPVAAPQPAAVPAPTAVPVNTAVPVQQEPLPTGIPTQVRAYSVNDLAIACRPLMEAGKQPELQALLAEFGAPAGLASVPENRRAEFAGRLRQMGGQI
jgi:hypothetical protein